MRRAHSRDLLTISYIIVFFYCPNLSRMSRIGKLPIVIPEWVAITQSDQTLSVKGPKWELRQAIPYGVEVQIGEALVTCSIINDEYKSFRGLFRAVVANMVEWVTEWFEKKLHVIGVGYAVKVQWDSLVLNLWYSHPIDHTLPEGIEASAEKDQKWNDIIVLRWIDKQLVGEQAAKIRSYRPPEPYKGKWVRYFWEYIKMKAGKTATTK
jgi:large subunit ribosomal protein L6